MPNEVQVMYVKVDIGNLNTYYVMEGVHYTEAEGVRLSNIVWDGFTYKPGEKTITFNKGDINLRLETAGKTVYLNQSPLPKAIDTCVMVSWDKEGWTQLVVVKEGNEDAKS